MSRGTPIQKTDMARILDHVYNWGFGDIVRASIEGNAKLAGFILGACLIDALAGFYAGVTKETCKYGSGERFKQFVGKYMTRYDANNLWVDLRCGLVHSYASGKSYAFTDANRAGYHFDKRPDGMTILNLEDFLADIKHAFAEYRKDVLSDDALFVKAETRVGSLGIMALLTQP